MPRHIIHTRRLEDRIRMMCRKALAAENPEVDTVISELKSALREHIQRLRNLAAKKLVGNWTSQPPDRRSN